MSEETYEEAVKRLNADSLRIVEEQNRVMDEFALLVSFFNEKYVALMKDLPREMERKK